MPTFTAVALDRLLHQSSSSKSPPSSSSSEPRRTTVSGGDARSASMRPVVPLGRRNSTTLSSSSDPRRTTAAAVSDGGDARSVSNRSAVPLGRRNSTPAETDTEKSRISPPSRRISPALYKTPETVPLPDSPESSRSVDFESPYFINHKRRGPRLSKSVSEQNVAVTVEGEAEVSSVVENPRLIDTEVVETDPGLIDREMIDSRRVSALDAVEDQVKENSVNEENEGLEAAGEAKTEGDGETEDFYDIQDSLSYVTISDMDDYNVERSGRATTPRGEFFDAWEELSSDSGRQSRRSFHDLEAEVREMRLSLLMEIEKRKQAEEALNNMRNQWQILREKMRVVGLVVPPDSFPEDGKPEIDTADEICQQLVSECIGMEVAKDEAEAILEAQLETKNFEIARLNDRMHYYETINREMSQRNQEAIERARHDRQKRERRHRWVWGSVGAAITVGSIALAWSYSSGGKASSSTTHLESADHDTSAGN